MPGVNSINYSWVIVTVVLRISSQNATFRSRFTPNWRLSLTTYGSLKTSTATFTRANSQPIPMVSGKYRWTNYRADYLLNIRGSSRFKCRTADVSRSSLNWRRNTTVSTSPSRAAHTRKIPSAAISVVRQLPAAKRNCSHSLMTMK